MRATFVRKNIRKFQCFDDIGELSFEIVATLWEKSSASLVPQTPASCLQPNTNTPNPDTHAAEFAPLFCKRFFKNLLVPLRN